MPPAETRRDVRVPNESDGFVFTSAALRGAGLSPGDERWESSVAAGDLLPLAVESEDPATIRVVVGGELDAAESAEWVGRVSGPLRLADGRLALCGGIAYVLDGSPAVADEFVRVIEVPPGTYRATVYCYPSAPNGRWCVEEAAFGETAGGWWRRTRPGQPFPPWLHNLCVHDPDVDPGHQAQWRRAREVAGPAVVDLLVHLQPAATATTPLVLAEHGFVEAGDCRLPEPCPAGIPAVGVEGPAGEPAPPPAPPSSTASSSGEPVPIADGPVTVPVVKVARLARVAWMCHPYTRPTLRLAFPSPAPPLAEVERARIRARGAQVEVTFDDDGQPQDALDPLTAIGRQLATVPDGTVIELETAPARAPERAGRHRYRGVVEQGAWRVSEAAPAVEAARLAEAVALAEALENGRRLTARDEAEAERIEADLRQHLADLLGANLLLRTGTEVALKRRDPALFGHVAARVFRMRYAGAWPIRES